jgi:hypothetical protein
MQELMNGGYCSMEKHFENDARADIEKLIHDVNNYRYVMVDLQCKWFDELSEVDKDGMKAKRIIDDLNENEDVKKVFKKYGCNEPTMFHVNLAKVCEDKEFKDDKGEPIFTEDFICGDGKYYYVYIALNKKGMIWVVGMTSFHQKDKQLGDLFGSFTYLSDLKNEPGWADILVSYVSTADEHKENVIGYYNDREGEKDFRDKNIEMLTNDMDGITEVRYGNHVNYVIDNFASDAIIIPIKAQANNHKSVAESVEFLIAKILDNEKRYPIGNDSGVKSTLLQQHFFPSLPPQNMV